MALYEELEKIIEERQKELKNYRGAELYLKTAELAFLKSQVNPFRFMNDRDENVVKGREKQLENYRNGKFTEFENLIFQYSKRIEAIYKKTGLSPLALLPEITLAKENENPAENEELEFFIYQANIDDETAKKFRKKFYESGIAVTSSPIIDDTSFNGRSFIERLNIMMSGDQPLNHMEVLNMIAEKLRSDIPGMEQDYVNPFDYIRIGGKTAEEKWASKYPNMSNEEKRGAYAFELLQAITNGTEEISLLRPMVKKLENGEKEITTVGKTVLVQSRKNLERTRVFLSELNDFSNLFAGEYPQIENPGVQIEPGAQKYFDEFRNAGRKLLQKASSVNYEQNSFADFTNAYWDYVSKTTDFMAHQLMEMQTTKLEFERSLQGNPNITNEVRQYRQANIRRLEEEIKNFEPRFNKHLEALKKSFLRVENYSRGLKVSSKDDPWEKAENFTFSKLINNYRPTAMLRGWGQDVLDPSRSVPLVNNLSWVKNLDQRSFHTTKEQRDLMIASSEKERDRGNTCLNSMHMLEMNLSLLTGNEKDTGNVGAYIKDLGFKDRLMTFQSLFNMWVMVNKNKSLSETASLYKAHIPVGKDNQGNDIYPENKETVEQYEKEFIQFCIDHPFSHENVFKNEPESQALDEKKIEAQKNSIRTWTNLIHNAYKKVSDYSMPDIDYSDPAQVKEYEDEFKLLSGFSVDAKQEINELVEIEDNNTYFDAKRIAAESIGGEKNFYAMTTGLKTLQEFVNAVYKLPNEFLPNLMGDASLMSNQVFYRSNAGRLMCTHRGESVGSIIHNYPGELAPYAPVYGSYVIESANKDTGNYVKAASYLLHVNEKAYNNYVAEEISKFEKREREETLQNDIGKYVLEARANPISEEFRRALMTTSDQDPKDMADFLSEKVDGNLTGKDLVANRFDKMIARNLRGILMQNGINASDMFLINGHKPSEIWGNKYRNVKNPEEKEWLYRAEILKCIESQESLIQVRMFKISEDNSLVDLKEPVTVHATRQAMKDGADKIKDYLIAKREILSTLYQVRDELISTQENSDANFYSKDRTGSTEYQNFCLAVKNAISDLERWQTKPSQVLEKLKNVDDAAAEYYTAKKGIFGGNPKTDSGLIRFKSAEKVMGDNYSLHNGKLTQYFTLHLNRINLNIAIVPPNKKPGDDVVDTLLKVGMDEINKGLRRAPVDLDFEETTKVKEFIQRNLNSTKRHPNYRNMASYTPEKQAAIKYMIGFLEEKIQDPLNGAPQQHLTYTLARKAESFWFEVDRLAKQEAFQRYVKEDPEGCLKKWESCEKRSKDIKEDREIWLDRNISQPGRSFMSYVVNSANNNQQTPENQIREAWNNPAQMQNYYGRLAEVVLAQILTGTTKESETIRNEMARGTASYNNLKDVVGSILQQQNLLRGRNLNKMESRLKSGETAKELTKTVREKFLSAVKRTKQNKEREIQQTVGMLTAMDLNKDGVIQKNELDSFVNGSKIQMGQNAMAEYDAAAQRLHSTLHVSVNKAGEDQKEQKVEEDVTIDFKPLANTLGFSCDLDSSIQRHFILWTMGAKNMEFADAVKLCNTVPRVEKGVVVNAQDVKNADQLRYEFFDFCRKHPVNTNEVIPAEQQEYKRSLFTTNFEEWAKIYAKATENMKKYSIPDVNYRDLGNVERQLPTISILSSISAETGEEMRNLFGFASGMLSGEKAARDVLGDDVYRDMNAFWLNLKDQFFATANAYKTMENMEGKPKSDVYKFMMNSAFLREVSMAELQNARKLNLGEITDKARRDANACSHSDAISEIMKTNRANGYPSFNGQEAYQFLQGKTDGTFAQKAERLYNAQFRTEQNKFKNAYLQDISNFRNSLSNDITRIRQAFVGEYYNDNRFVLNLMNKKVSDLIGNNPDGNNLNADPNSAGQTVRDFLNNQFHKLMASGVVSTILQQEKIQISDLFQLDEIPPLTIAESVGDRYGRIDDPALKEDLLRLELLNKIVMGDQRILIRNFDVRDNKITETEPLVFMTKDEKVVEASATIMQLQEATKDLHDELEVYKANLQKSQNNPNANFDPNVEPEGHDQYKELIRTLKNALSVTQDGGRNSTRQQIDNALSALNTAAANYHRSHTGFFGGEPIHDYGKKRYHNSDYIKTSVDEFLERQNRLLRKLPTDVLSSQNGEMLHTAKTSDALEMLNQMAGVQGIQSVVPSRENAYQDYLKSEVKREYKNYKLTYAKNDYPSALDDLLAENVNLAIKYLGELWDKKSKENTLEYKDLKTVMHPRERIRELATNGLFLEMYRENPKQTLNHWERIEANAKSKKAEVDGRLETIKTQYGSLAEFVAGFEKKSNHNNRGDVTLEEVENKILEKSSTDQGKGQLYGRLAYVVLMGIMNSDTDMGKRLRYEDAMNPSGDQRPDGFYYQLCRKLGACMLQGDTLGEEQWRDTIMRLEDGRLIKDAERFISRHDLLNDIDHTATMWGFANENLNPVENKEDEKQRADEEEELLDNRSLDSADFDEKMQKRSDYKTDDVIEKENVEDKILKAEKLVDGIYDALNEIEIDEDKKLNPKQKEEKKKAEKLSEIRKREDKKVGDENYLNDAEGIVFNENGFMEQGEIDFEGIAVAGNQGIERELDDLDYFFNGDHFFEEGDYQDYELDKRNIINPPKQIDLLQYGVVQNENPDNQDEMNEIIDNEIINSEIIQNESGENKINIINDVPKFVKEPENEKESVDESDYEEERISRIDESLNKKGEINDDKSVHQKDPDAERLKLESSMNNKNADSSRKFMEKNASRPNDVKPDEFLLLRKQAFILVFGAETLKEKGLPFSEAELGKQRKKWLTEEPFKSILDTMMKDNTDKELLALIDQRKVPEEVARIQEGRPKQIKPEVKPGDAKPEVPELNGHKAPTGPKPNGSM